MKHDEQTIQFYNQNAADYAAWSSKNNPVKSLRRFCAGLNRGASVLDAGCGSGWDSERLVNDGFKVTAIDASRAMVDEANCRPGVDAVHMRFEEMRWNSEFDGIWANASLQHVPRNAFSDTVRILARSLKPGGVFYCGIHGGTGVIRDRIGRLYCRYNITELKDYLTAAKLEILWSDQSRGTGFDGSSIEFIQLECRKASMCSDIPKRSFT